jgi:probable phosphoglycerate mutase
MTEIWFIRHGETDWNRSRRIQGWKDIPLNEAGETQAQRLAERLARDAQDQPFDAIYSSDLQRAHHTARPTAERLALRVRTEPGIRERSYGVSEGLDTLTSEQLAPEARAAWKSRDPDRAIEGGEALGQFRARILSTVEDLATRHEGQRLLVFTHGGVLDILWRRARGLELDVPRDVPLLNVGVNRIAISGKDWRVDSWADVSHMGIATDSDVVP